MKCLKVVMTGSPVQITTDPDLYASIINFQNQGAATMTIGDSTVATTGGIQLSGGTPGGAATFQMAFPRGTHLVDYWATGTSTQVLIVLYESSM